MEKIITSYVHLPPISSIMLALKLFQTVRSSLYDLIYVEHHSQL